MNKTTSVWLNNLEPGCLMEWRGIEPLLCFRERTSADCFTCSLGLDAELEQLAPDEISDETIMYLDASWVTFSDSFDEYVKIRVLNKEDICYILLFNSFQQDLNVFDCIPHLYPSNLHQLIITKTKEN